MENIELKELKNKIDSILTKNRDLLSENDISALEECKERLEELGNFKIKGNYELRNKILVEATSLLLKFLFSEL